jgi:hypothetical protein
MQDHLLLLLLLAAAADRSKQVVNFLRAVDQQLVRLGHNFR